MQDLVERFLEDLIKLCPKVLGILMRFNIMNEKKNDRIVKHIPKFMLISAYWNMVPREATIFPNIFPRNLLRTTLKYQWDDSLLLDINFVSKKL